MLNFYMSNLPTPKPPAIKARINNQGLVEIVDLHTGRVVAVQGTGNIEDYLRSRFDNLVRIETEEGPVYLEKHLDPERVIHRSRAKHTYSLTWGYLLVEAILTGQTRRKAAMDLQIPHATISQWCEEHEEFRELLENAEKNQARLLHDEAIDTARSTTSKDDVPQAALLVKTLQQAAALADPERFGVRQKVEHSGNVAHTFVIETGIRRGLPPPPGFEEALRDVQVTISAPDTPEAHFTGGDEVSDQALVEEASPVGVGRGGGEEDGQVGKLLTSDEAREIKQGLFESQDKDPLW